MSLSPGGFPAGILAIDDRPELEMQRRVVRNAGDLGERLAGADEVAYGDLDLGDVVVVGDEAEPSWVMVDADVRSVAARLDLDLDDPPAIGGVDAVPCLRGKVDGLMQAVEESDVAVRRVRRIVGEDDLGRVAFGPAGERPDAGASRSARSRGAAGAAARAAG